MAFRFQWPYFSEEFIQEAKTMLTSALNKGSKPPVIVDHITVKELDMGTLPPELEMLEMGELSTERFRGIFKLTYSGDAHIVLQTKVQANPMNVKKSDNPSYTRRGILAADQPLVVPMLLRISDFKLRGIIVLVVDQIKGITLVFKNDPLESVLVSSTFDSITPIQRFLQSEIEKQLKNLFQEDLPTAIHNLSQQFTKKPEDVSRHHSHDDQGRPGIYDGGLNTPMVSQNPSRRASVSPRSKKSPGKTSSQPDMSMGVNYDYDGLQPARKPASATVRSESPGPSTRHGHRDPHTEYPVNAQSDLLQESLRHPANRKTHSRPSRASSRRPSSSSDPVDPPKPSALSAMEQLSMRDELFQPSLGIAESTHLANQFAYLTHSNQTISPLSQNLEHFAFRTGTPKRPASVQYYSHSSMNGSPSPGARSGASSVSGYDISKDGLGHKIHSANGSPSQFMGGSGQGSPRTSHRRLTGRVGIRRYAMQLGAGNGPRELSDYDSDEYNDPAEALSENEFVHVEKTTARSLAENENHRHHHHHHHHHGPQDGSLHPSNSGKSMASSPPSSSSPTVSRPQLSRRRSSKQQQGAEASFGMSASTGMPGGFTTGSETLSWRSKSGGHPGSLEKNTRVESRSSSFRGSNIPPETEFRNELEAMQLNGSKSLSMSQPSPSSPPTSSMSTLASSTTGWASNATARSFSSTQSSRLPPPQPLKRDKRNSSILSSRRVSSVGIGLGVLSKEGDRRSTGPTGLMSSTSSQRPSLYKTTPISTSPGWHDLDRR
ncbi:ERMES complex subunit [Lunasporangiospora selenospora]|uniref:Mitochondrial distribution and morphology protein 34 n=1 Tax=Lunasporangiospora selenospora TaxID=979761 RepID=A0A9P6FSR3_9FUNG|nr:ERMES complex subunit [Lunasporangiospora selenospora]